MRAFVVLGFVFPYQAKRLAWGMSLKWPILFQVGRKTLTPIKKGQGLVDDLLWLTLSSLVCFDTVGWATGRASRL